jgi:hypothetical protein
MIKKFGIGIGVLIVAVGMLGGCGDKKEATQKAESEKSEKETPSFITAIKKGDVKLAEKQIEEGADVNIKNNNGSTALIFAVANNNKLATKLLIEKGADVNVINKDYMTPLLFAVQTKSNSDIMGILIDAGADVNIARGNDGESPLLLAIALSTESNAIKLLNNGADIEHKNKKGATPLMYALNLKKYKVVKVLLNKGADINAVDNNGRKVSEYDNSKYLKDKEERVAKEKAPKQKNAEQETIEQFEHLYGKDKYRSYIMVTSSHKGCSVRNNHKEYEYPNPHPSSTSYYNFYSSDRKEYRKIKNYVKDGGGIVLKCDGGVKCFGISDESGKRTYPRSSSLEFELQKHFQNNESVMNHFEDALQKCGIKRSDEFAKQKAESDRISNQKTAKKKNNPYITQFKESGSLVITNNGTKYLTTLKPLDKGSSVMKLYKYEGDGQNDFANIPFDKTGKIKVEKGKNVKTNKDWFRVNFGYYSNKWWKAKFYYNGTEISQYPYLYWDFSAINDAENFEAFLEYLIANNDSLRSKILGK